MAGVGGGRRERVGVKGEREGEGGREAGRVGYSGRERGGGGEGGGAHAWDSVSSTWQTLQVSLKCCIRDTLPSVSRCLLWPGVRKSEPLSQQ